MGGRDAATSGDADPMDDEYYDLLRQISDAGWTVGSIYASTEGVTRQFREGPYESDFPGMVERHVSGKTDKDAFRAFLKQLDDEKAAQGT